MGRIRSIKPEFWWSRTVGNLTERQMLTFIGLWNFADDYGLVEADYDYLAGMIWLRKQWTASDVEADMDRLVKVGLVERVEATLVASGQVKQALSVVSWSEHQRVNNRSKPRFERVVKPPKTPESTPILTEPSRSPQVVVREGSRSDGQLIPLPLPPEPTEPVVREDSRRAHVGLRVGTGSREQGAGNRSTTPAVAGSKNFGKVYSDRFYELTGDRPPTQSVKRVARDATALVVKESRDPDVVEAAVCLAAEQGHANVPAAYLAALKRPQTATDKFRAMAAQFAAEDEGRSDDEIREAGVQSLADRYAGGGSGDAR